MRLSEQTNDLELSVSTTGVTQNISVTNNDITDLH